MHRSLSRVLGVGIAPLLVSVTLLSAATGCTGSPIGDPCIPESIPPNGFDNREIYLETSSVQCRTRVCMVYQLDGNPETICDASGLPEGCVTETELDQQVFCSCRCSITEGGQANTPLCNCADGFTCIDDIVTEGGAGVRGGYCVPCRRDPEPRPLTDVFDDCPEPT
jgi:hypothetical protein